MNKWWEARSSWDTIGNCCGSIGAQIVPLLATEEASELTLMQLVAFVVCLKAALRDTHIDQAEIGDAMDWSYCRALNRSKNSPVQALKMLSETVRRNLPNREEDKHLSSAVFNELSEQIRVINHSVGACMKIKETPTTYGYVAALRSILIIWLGTMPMALMSNFGWFTVPASGLIAYLYLALEQMAVEIEQPFGDDADDLPIEKYILELEASLLEMRPGFVLPDSEEAARQLQAQRAASVSPLEMRIKRLERWGGPRALH